MAATTSLTACGGGGSGGTADPLPSASATNVSAQSQEPLTLDSNVPIATRTVTYDGDSVRVDILSLQRHDELSTLRFSLTYLGTEQYSVNNDLGSPTSYDVSGVSLIDGRNSKRYLAARDSADHCVCSSTIGVQLKPHTTYQLSSTFAAPPRDVTRVQLDIPGVGTLSNFPVS